MDMRIEWHKSLLAVCHDGYSLSGAPVPGFDYSEVLARVNERQPLISIDGNSESEILKTVFNIGLKKPDEKPLWIVPNSIRHCAYGSSKKDGTAFLSLESGFPKSPLHRQFAGLMNKDEKAILDFANRCGLLRRQPVHDMVFRERDTGKQCQLGESLLWWKEEIGDLAACLGLWDMVLAGDEDLKNVVLWHRDGITIRLGDDYVQLVGRANMHLADRWSRGDARGPALYYLSLEADKRLINALTPKMLASQDCEIYFYPATLLAVIWLMFLWEVSGRTRLIKCPGCGEYFDARDPRTIFCSTRCRMRIHRKRNTQKLKKRNQKGEILAISKDLNCHLATVYSHLPSGAK